MKPQYDETQIDLAWSNVQAEIKDAGRVSPAPGFVNRFRLRLAERRLVEDRQRALRIVFLNSLAALVIFALIVTQALSPFEEPGDVFFTLVDMAKNVVIFFKMIMSILATFSRTVPKLISLSSWFSAFVAVGGFLLVWVSSVKRQMQQIGVPK